MAQDDIQGTVVDASGNPISGAIVELTRSYQSNPTTQGTVKRTTTDANGNYIFERHPDGNGTTLEYHVSCYNYDGTAYVNSENNPGVTADLSPAIPDSVLSRPVDDNGGADVSNEHGVIIEAKSDWPSIGAEISNDTSGQTTAYLRQFDGTLIDSVDVSGLSAGGTYTHDGVDLIAGNKYQMTLDADGASWSVGVATTGADYPYTSDDVDITARVIDQTDIGDDDDDVRSVNNIGDTGF